MTDVYSGNIERVRRNVSKMLGAGAPEADVDKYLSTEGVSAQQLRGEFVQADTGTPKTPINLTREVGFWPNFWAGFKSTPEGAVGMLKSGHPAAGGYDDVATDRGGNVMVKDKGEWIPMNKPGFSQADVAQMGAPVAMSLPAVPATNPLTVGGLTAAAEAGRQAVGRYLIPGGDPVPMSQRALQAGIAGGTGLLAQGATGLALRGAENAWPKNIVASSLRKAGTKPVAKQAARLERRVGTKLTPGQATGHKGAQWTEALLRRHPATAEQMDQFYTKQLDTTLGYLDRTLDNVSAAKGISPARLGADVRHAVTQALKVARTHRRNAAKVDFGQVDSASGGMAVLEVNNTLKSLDDLIERFDVPGGGDATATLVGKLRKLRADFGRKPVTGQEMQRLLEVYGSAAHGSGKILKDIDDAQHLMIAGRVQRALLSDLDVAVDQLDVALPKMMDDNVAQALKTARSNYRANSSFINDVGDSALGKVLNDPNIAPERVARSIANMYGTELTAAANIVKQYKPETAQMVKRFIFEDAMEGAFRPKAAKAPVPKVDGGEAFSAARFTTRIRQSGIWDTLERKERFELATAVRMMERIIHRIGEGSPTASLTMADKMLRVITTGGWNPAMWGEAMATLVAPRYAAKLLTTTEGRQSLVKLAQIGPKTKGGISTITRALSLVAQTPDIEGENIAPHEELQGAY